MKFSIHLTVIALALFTNVAGADGSNATPVWIPASNNPLLIKIVKIDGDWATIKLKDAHGYFTVTKEVPTASISVLFN